MPTEDDEEFPVEQIENLEEYSREISDNYGEIEFVFDDVFNSDRTANNFDDYFSTMTTTLLGIIEEGDEVEVASDLINIVLAYDKELYSWMADQDSDIVHEIKDLNKKYGLPIQRRLNRIRQGHNYWSNVKSDTSVRSNYPSFSHEFVIDHKDVLEINSGMTGTLTLSHHFLQQVTKSPDVIGEDVLSFIDKEQVEHINQKSQQLIDRLEEYQPPEDEEIGWAENTEEEQLENGSDGL